MRGSKHYYYADDRCKAARGRQPPRGQVTWTETADGRRQQAWDTAPEQKSIQSTYEVEHRCEQSGARARGHGQPDADATQSRARAGPELCLLGLSSRPGVIHGGRLQVT